VSLNSCSKSQNSFPSAADLSTSKTASFASPKWAELFSFLANLPSLFFSGKCSITNEDFTDTETLHHLTLRHLTHKTKLSWQTDRHPINGWPHFQDNLGKLAPKKVKPFWILMKQEMTRWSGISWTICKSSALTHTDNHASTSPLNFFTGRMLFLTPNQWCQS